MLSRSSPFTTTSRPPDLIIHSSRWSRYSRLKSPFSTSSATLGMVAPSAFRAAMSATQAATDGRALARSSQAASFVPAAGGLPCPTEPLT